MPKRAAMKLTGHKMRSMLDGPQHYARRGHALRARSRKLTRLRSGKLANVKTRYDNSRR
jgi:hypothetical protein